MPDQSINIVVTESGTQQLIQMLQQLGVSADQATAKVESGFIRMSTSQSAAVANQVLLARAAQEGSVDMTLLADALDKMSNAELTAAMRAGQFAGAQDVANASARSGAGSIGEHEAKVSSLAGAYRTLAPLIGGVVAFLGAHEFIEAADEYTNIVNRINAVQGSFEGASSTIVVANGKFVDVGETMQSVAGSARLLANQNTEVQETFAALADNAIRTGTSIESAAELYSRLASGAKEAGVSQKDLVTFTNLVEEQLQIFGVGARQARATMNELAEGFSEGEIKGKQLTALLREFPQALQPLADAKFGGNINAVVQAAKAGSTELVANARNEGIALEDEAKTAGDRIVAAAKGSSSMQIEEASRRRQTLIADAQLQSSQLLKSANQTGIGVRDIVQAYIADFSKIEAAFAKVFTPISRALESLHDQWIIYVGTSAVAQGATDAIVGSIHALGFALPVIIPLVAALGLGLAAWKIAPLIGELSSLLGIFTPWGAIITGVGAALTLLIGSTAEYYQQTGQAKDATEAWKKALEIFAPIWDTLKTLFTDVGKLLTELIAPGFDTAGQKSGNYADTLKDIVRVTADIITGFDNFVKDLQAGWAVIITAIANAIIVVKNFAAVLSGLPTQKLITVDVAMKYLQGQGSGGGDNSQQQNTLSQRDGGMIHAATGYVHSPKGQGSDFRIPGADRPDTVFLPMMVSRGERVIVQTEAQQSHYDRVMHAVKKGNIHFRDGGMIHAATGAMLAPEDQNLGLHLVGAHKYKPGAHANMKHEKALAMATRLPHYANGIFDVPSNQYNWLASGNAGALQLSGLTSASEFYQQQGVNNMDAPGSGQFMSAASQGTTGFSGFNISTAAYDRYQGNISKVAGIDKQKAASQQIDTPFSSSDGAQFFAHTFQQQVFAGGPGSDEWKAAKNNLWPYPSDDFNHPTFYTTGHDPKFKDSSGKDMTFPMNRAPNSGPGGANSAVGPYGALLAQNGQTSYYPAIMNGQPFYGWEANKNLGKVPNNGDSWWHLSVASYLSMFGEDLGKLTGADGMQISGVKNNANTSLTGQTEQDLFGGFDFRDGGMIHARDGLDYMVPGTGGPDTRLMRMMVSPGEHVSVKTPQQQQQSEKNVANGTTIHAPITIMANDPSAFNRSKRQVADEVSRGLRRATNRT